MRTRTMAGNNIVFFKSAGTVLRRNSQNLFSGYQILIPDEIPTDLDENGLYIVARRTSYNPMILAYKQNEGWVTMQGETIVERLESGTLYTAAWNSIYHRELVINKNSVLVSSNFSTEQHGVADSLKQRLSVIKNELWYNYNYGLPLLDKGATKAMFDAKVVQIVKSHPDVIDIIDIESHIEDRKYYCNIEIQSTYGSLSVSI